MGRKNTELAERLILHVHVHGACRFSILRIIIMILLSSVFIKTKKYMKKMIGDYCMVHKLKP